MASVSLKPVTLVSFLTLVFFSSCATIFNGPTTKVKLEYSDSTTVTVDNVKLAPGVKEFKVKSKDNHTVVLSRSGHKPATIELFPVRQMTSLANYAGALVGIPLMMNVGDNKDGGQIRRLNTAMGISILAPATMFLIDGVSGSNFKSYPNTIKYNPIKLPPQQTAKDQFQIGSTDVNLRIKIGEKIGASRYNGKEVSQIYWENTVNVKAEELEVIVNNGLKDLGFKVPKEISDNGYILNAEITSINIDNDLIGGMYAATNLAECKLTTKWTLTETATNEEIKTYSVESVNSEKTKSLNNAFLSAFENSFLSFMQASPEVYTKTAKTKAVVSLTNFEPISITKTKALAKSSLQENIQSVVTIENENSHGSGFIISDDGYVVTNYHVVKNSKQVNVIMQNGISFVGDVVRFDQAHDVALIKLGGKGFKPLKLSEEASTSEIGAEVYAVGTPADKSLSQTVSKGIISGNRLINDITYLQTDVSVSPGSSGGALMNKNGLVLGIVTSKIINKGVEGISFALPSSKIFEVLKISYR